MASVVPDKVNQAIGDIGNFFTNVQESVQTVDSVYKQVTGQAESLSTGQVAPAVAPAVKPAALTTTTQPQTTTAESKMPDGGTVAVIGILVLFGVLVFLKG
jgi:phage-related minor tail protein